MQSKLLFWPPKSCMIWFLSIFLTMCPLPQLYSTYTGLLIPKVLSPFLLLDLCACYSFCLKCFSPAFHMTGSFSYSVSAQITSSYRTSLVYTLSRPLLAHIILFTSFQALTTPSDDPVCCLLSVLFPTRMLSSVRAGTCLSCSLLHPGKHPAHSSR